MGITSLRMAGQVRSPDPWGWEKLKRPGSIEMEAGEIQRGATTSLLDGGDENVQAARSGVGTVAPPHVGELEEAARAATVEAAHELPVADVDAGLFERQKGSARFLSELDFTLGRI